MSITNNQFRISLPDTWKETTVYTFEGPHDSGVQHNLVLSIVPDIKKDTELKRFAKDLLLVSAEALPGFEMINEEEKTTPSGMPIYVAVYKYSPSDELTYYQKQYFMIREGKGYVFTSTFSKKTLQTIANEVDEIVAGFEVVEIEHG